MIISLVPTAAFLIFGTQQESIFSLRGQVFWSDSMIVEQDILDAWGILCIWRWLQHKVKLRYEAKRTNLSPPLDATAESASTMSTK